MDRDDENVRIVVWCVRTEVVMILKSRNAWGRKEGSSKDRFYVVVRIVVWTKVVRRQVFWGVKIDGTF